LVERKRIDLLLRAIAQLSSAGFSDFSVAIVGRGPERAHLEALTGQLGISSSVEFRGYLEDSELFDLLEAADICVMPSAYEGGMPPLVVLEAMAYGAVPLVSDIPQLSNSIIDRQNGRTFARDSPDSLAKALTELMTDALSLSRYSHSARQWSAERSWKSVADGYMEAYRKALGGTIR
jgi:glycosyltransferase involved in cell wall biosynthesis